MQNWKRRPKTALWQWTDKRIWQQATVWQWPMTWFFHGTQSLKGNRAVPSRWMQPQVIQAYLHQSPHSNGN